MTAGGAGDLAPIWRVRFDAADRMAVQDAAVQTDPASFYARFAQIGRGHNMVRLQGDLTGGLAAARDAFSDAVALRIIDRRDFSVQFRPTGAAHGLQTTLKHRHSARKARSAWSRRIHPGIKLNRNAL